MTTTRADQYQEVTDRVIAALEAGTAPWHKPWSTATGLPVSLSTRKPYRGINVFLLGLQAMSEGYVSPWWGTYKWIKANGGQVRRDEKSTTITFWKRIVTNERDKVTGKKKIIPMLKTFRVFNSDQADWEEGRAPQVVKIDKSPVERIAAAEAIMAGYPNPPIARTGSAAFYRPSTDELTMPPRDDFDSAEYYASTWFHEATHSTGHASRLNRPGIADIQPFGTPCYAKEELVAEMGAAMLSAIAGLDQTATLPNSASYLQSWITVLRGDPKLVVQAAAQAQKAADHIRGVTWGSEDTED